MQPSGKEGHRGYVLIVGCGRLGANLANSLYDGGGSVVVIDKNPDAFRKLSPSFGGISVIGDATDMNALREAEIERAQTVIAVTNRDNTNVMVAQLAKEMFHTRQVIARLYDPECEDAYREFGIETICPAVLSATEIDGILGARGTGERSE